LSSQNLREELSAIIPKKIPQNRIEMHLLVTGNSLHWGFLDIILEVSRAPSTRIEISKGLHEVLNACLLVVRWVFWIPGRLQQR
jgi:hypothetical protein